MRTPSSFRRTVPWTAVLLAVALTAPAQPPNCTVNPTEPFIDNRDGYLVNFEEAPIHPMELSWNSKKLYVTNIPDARISVFDLVQPGKPVLIKEIPVGLGPVTVRRRPPQAGQTSVLFRPMRASAMAEQEPIPDDALRQLWVVCASSNALFMIDEDTLEVTDSLRLPHRPSGLVFDAAGSFAYVSLSDSNQIAKVDANNPHGPLTYFEFESDMPLGSAERRHVEEPRALLRSGSDLYVLSFLSGNGSTAAAADLLDPTIVQLWNFQSIVPVPPDRDALHFNLAQPSPQGSAALWRMGTLNFDIERRASTGRLYVSSLEMLNQDVQLQGEPEYQQKGFALHTVSHAAPSTSGNPQSGTVTVDLNDSANHGPTLHAAFRCAVPNDMIFNRTGTRLFAACADSRNVALLDPASDLVIADFKVTTGQRGFGIRGVLLDGSERWLYAYGRGDNTLLVFDTQNLPAGAPKPPGRILSVGFDITPQNILDGRFQFLNAANSADGLSTCNTCHVDGHLDAVAWDLSDFTGDLAANPRHVPRVPKGGKVTMSLLGIEETPPFHWRGDRADLKAFNPAFSGLLGGQMLDTTPGGDLDRFQDFVFSLSYPPNPHQNLDRSYTADARVGFDCFSMEDAHDVTLDTTGLVFPPPPTGLLRVSCEGCHSMAGASATLNQINNPVVGLLADDATQLRGVWDKISDTVDYTPILTCPGDFFCDPFLTRIPATGWGVANTGFVDSVLDFVNLPVFNLLPAGSQDEVSQFVLELDTGSAPTTAATHQLDGTLPTGPPYPSPVQELIDGVAGPVPANDLIVRGWILRQGIPRPIGMLFDGGVAPNGVFITDTVDNPAAGCTADASVTPGAAGIGPFTLSQLDALVAAGQAALTLIGTPVGSGYRLSLDRDMDCLRDGDEAAYGTNSSTPDKDSDGFPDGYEVRLGSNPNLATSTPTDLVAPTVPTSAIAWRNSNVMKVRWTTDEESRSILRVFELPGGGGTPILVFEKSEDQFKRDHVLVARGLAPDRNYSVEVETADPSGNNLIQAAGTNMTQPHLFDSVHLASTTLTHLGAAPSNPNLEQYRVDFHAVDEDGGDLDAEVTFTLVEWVPTQGSCVSTTPAPDPCNQGPLVALATGVGGISTLTFEGKLDFLNQSGFAEAFATAVDFPAASTEVRLYFHSLDGQFGHWDQAVIP